MNPSGSVNTKFVKLDASMDVVTSALDPGGPKSVVTVPS
jgi:hypothetical protein